MEFIFELILQVVFEAVAELGVRAVGAPFQRRPNPWLAAVGYALLGAVAGGLSWLIFPGLFIAPGSARIANLVLTPIAAGAAMAWLGRWRSRRGQEVIHLDRFAYGYLFALAMAFTRYALGN